MGLGSTHHHQGYVQIWWHHRHPKQLDLVSVHCGASFKDLHVLNANGEAHFNPNCLKRHHGEGPGSVSTMGARNETLKIANILEPRRNLQRLEQLCALTSNGNAYLFLKRKQFLCQQWLSASPAAADIYWRSN